MRDELRGGVDRQGRKMTDIEKKWDELLQIGTIGRDDQNADEYRNMMSESSKNWDMSRLAFMDVVIMQTALAEITTFPQIPLNVTLNEYVEIAKYYSTPKSSSFINGLLDSIIKNLKKENKINK